PSELVDEPCSDQRGGATQHHVRHVVGEPACCVAKCCGEEFDHDHRRDQGNDADEESVNTLSKYGASQAASTHNQERWDCDHAHPDRGDDCDASTVELIHEEPGE